MTDHPTICRLRWGASRGLVAALGALIALVAWAAPAAATPTGDFADFDRCPVDNLNATTCLYSEITSGSFVIGNGTVPIDKPIVLQGAYTIDGETGETTFFPARDGKTLSRTPLTVPGGLLGIADHSGFGGWLLQWFWDIVNTANAVTATAELVGNVEFSFLNYMFGTGPAITLPVRIKLDNPFLGTHCYIGSARTPITLALTTGTTVPPAPNAPISGDRGAIDFAHGGDLITATGTRLVDNAFAVPGASDCGPFGFRWLVNSAVNLKQGIPARAGRNTAVLEGTVKIASAAAVKASGA